MRGEGFEQKAAMEAKGGITYAAGALTCGQKLRRAHPYVRDARRVMRSDEMGRARPCAGLIKQAGVIDGCGDGSDGPWRVPDAEEAAQAAPLRVGGVALKEEFVERAGVAWREMWLGVEVRMEAKAAATGRDGGGHPII